MGAPSDREADRKADQDADALDEGWETGSAAHNDRTAHALYVDPASVGRLIAGRGVERLAMGTDQDRTTIADGERTEIAPAPTLTEDSTVASIDQTMAELEAADVIVDHNKTQHGLGIAAKPALRPRFALLEPGRGPVPLEKERALVQPERSPLDFVMRDMDPAAPAKAHASGDSSRFLASFIGDQPPPPRVEAESPVITSMQPVLRRARLRRQWMLAAGALAATAVLATVLALKLTGAEAAPTTAASEAVKVAESPEPVAAPETPSNVETANPEQVAAAPEQANEPPPVEAPPEDVAPAEPEVVAMATPAETARPAKRATTAKPATAKKTVATKDVAKKSSTAKKAAPATKTTAKKPAPAKKSVATKSTTKKPTTAKKAAPTKKPTTAKKTTAKKPTTKKSTRSQRSDRRTRRTR